MHACMAIEANCLLQFCNSATPFKGMHRRQISAASPADNYVTTRTLLMPDFPADTTGPL